MERTLDAAGLDCFCDLSLQVSLAALLAFRRAERNGRAQRTCCCNARGACICEWCCPACMFSFGGSGVVQALSRAVPTSRLCALYKYGRSDLRRSSCRPAMIRSADKC